MKLEQQRAELSHFIHPTDYEAVGTEDGHESFPLPTKNESPHLPCIGPTSSASDTTCEPLIVMPKSPENGVDSSIDELICTGPQDGICCNWGKSEPYCIPANLKQDADSR